MIPPDQAIAIDGIRQFLKLHATCGGAAVDTPGLPDGRGYRAVAACRCGDTVEFWLTDALLPRQHVITAVARTQVA
jgi:hypothetical protein